MGHSLDAEILIERLRQFTARVVTKESQIDAMATDLRMHGVPKLISMISRSDHGLRGSDALAPSCQEPYFTLQPYGSVTGTLTGLPALSSASTCGTYCVALAMSAWSVLLIESIAPM